MCKVSVVIPHYNCFQYIKEAIDSVKAQTYENWEIIIMDDGSTDTPFEELKKLEEENIKVFSQENQGPAAARNAAIALSCGKYILPLDADDKIAPTYMEKAIPILENDSDIGIVYCKAEKFGRVNGYWDLPEYSEELMVIDNIIFCTAFFRKEDWERVGGFPVFARLGVEDYAFWLKLLSLGRKVVQIKEVLFYYRILETSRTTNFFDNRKGVIKTYADIFRDNIDFFVRHAEFLYTHKMNKCGQCFFATSPRSLNCFLLEDENIHFSDIKRIISRYITKKWNKLTKRG
ncbi:MAG: glycosyltransferase family 2 protein [Mailhella sp.]|nr:glycosyltransferase family 2 protein [Mailhella sp.]